MKTGRRWRGEAVIAVLTGLLGISLAATVQGRRGPNGLAAARQEDLVRILDDLDMRSERLSSEIAGLQRVNDQLRTNGTAAALAAAQARLTELRVLAGTVPVRGPGVVVTIRDPKDQVTSDVLVDAVEELRDAGAEAIQLSGVRVVVSTAIVDATPGVVVDGTPATAPYQVLAIGDPKTLAAALSIPGGVVDTVASAAGGARASVVEQPVVVIGAVRSTVAAAATRR